jgi:GTP-binding protein
MCGSDDVLKRNRKQVELAIDADVIIFVVDVEEGITPMMMPVELVA